MPATTPFCMAGFPLATVCLLSAVGLSDTANSLSVEVAPKENHGYEPAKCPQTVDVVQKQGTYTEESISQICSTKIGWRKCDFFGEALSLATSHPDFNGTHFCGNMEEAHFCHRTMDKLLSSVHVSDLAYGECTRAKPPKSDAYCKTFQRMFSYAVQSEDLDTLRACYMIQSYGNLTAPEPQSKEEKKDATSSASSTTTTTPLRRIIVSASNELESAGSGKAHANNTLPGIVRYAKEDIVVKPRLLKTLGEGDGVFLKSTTTTATTSTTTATTTTSTTGKQATVTVRPKEAPEQKAGPIIVEPVPAKKPDAKLLAKVVAHVGTAKTALAKVAISQKSRSTSAGVATSKRVASLVAHGKKTKKDGKDGYKGFLASFVGP